MSWVKAKITYTDGTEEVVTGQTLHPVTTSGGEVVELLVLDGRRYWPLIGVRSWEYLR